METLKLDVSPSWKQEDLDKVWKSLKTNKTMDPHGVINEAFKEGCIGHDLNPKRADVLRGGPGGGWNPPPTCTFFPAPLKSNFFGNFFFDS